MERGKRNTLVLAHTLRIGTIFPSEGCETGCSGEEREREEKNKREEDGRETGGKIIARNERREEGRGGGAAGESRLFLFFFFFFLFNLAARFNVRRTYTGCLKRRGEFKG